MSFSPLTVVAFSSRRRFLFIIIASEKTKISGWFSCAYAFLFSLSLFLYLNDVEHHISNSITCSPYECYCFNEKQFVGMSYLNWWSTLSAFAFMLHKYEIDQQKCSLLWEKRINWARLSLYWWCFVASLQCFNWKSCFSPILLVCPYSHVSVRWKLLIHSIRTCASFTHISPQCQALFWLKLVDEMLCTVHRNHMQCTLEPLFRKLNSQ